MIPFVLAGLTTAAIIAKNKHDAKQSTKQLPAPAPQVTQEQLQQILQAIYFMRQDIKELQEEMKTKATFH